ncbi:MAG: hypothetical protein KIS88_05535 [Anaerolineales bacterium]|nr:hypothetical protein [Anaerolineales bacterium]
MKQTYTLALLCFILALAAYLIPVALWERAYTPSAAYFNLLAEAFVQGRLYLIDPPTTIDLTLHNGQWYVPFPPLPALLMLPWVALFGVGSLNTVVFTAVLGAASVVLVFLILNELARRGWTQLSTSDNLWLTLLFGLGSVHWYMATLGEVWFVAQICTVTFVALSVYTAVRGGPAWLAGVALGLAVAARPNVALSFPLLLGIAAMHMKRIQLKGLLLWGAQAALPILLVAAALLAYNQARFGGPLDFGYEHAMVNPRLEADLAQYGQFDLHYVSRNVRAMLLAPPVWDAEARRLVPDGDGMSLLLTTPALAYLLWADKRTALARGAWTALGLLLIPLLLYYNTGWWQFGYRFSLDFMIPVMVLLATALRAPLSWLTRGLILAGVAVNLYGVLWWHIL